MTLNVAREFWDFYGGSGFLSDTISAIRLGHGQKLRVEFVWKNSEKHLPPFYLKKVMAYLFFSQKGSPLFIFSKTISFKYG